MARAGRPLAAGYSTKVHSTIGYPLISLPRCFGYIDGNARSVLPLDGSQPMPPPRLRSCRCRYVHEQEADVFVLMTAKEE